MSEVLERDRKALNLQPFDKADWDYWAGADQPADGSEPLIDYDVKVLGWPDFDIATVIVDGEGVAIYLANTDSLNATGEVIFEKDVAWEERQTVLEQLYQPLTPALLQRLQFVKVA